MKIDFTKQEYRTLVEMLLIADWVLTGHEVEPRDDTKPHDALRKKVLSHYKAMGMEDDIEYVEKHDDYFEPAAYEARAPHMRFIDDYDEQVFWDQLANRLAERDLAAETAAVPSGSIDQEAWLKRLFELTERYETALAESGLDCIDLVAKTSRMQ
jgi:hypothetical protein